METEEIRVGANCGWEVLKLLNDKALWGQEQGLKIRLSFWQSTFSCCHKMQGFLLY